MKTKRHVTAGGSVKNMKNYLQNKAFPPYYNKKTLREGVFDNRRIFIRA
jgi:hypothetical protein